MHLELGYGDPYSRGNSFTKGPAWDKTYCRKFRISSHSPACYNMHVLRTLVAQLAKDRSYTPQWSVDVTGCYAACLLWVSATVAEMTAPVSGFDPRVTCDAGRLCYGGLQQQMEEPPSPFY